ncbi:hypothetical protein Tco_1515988 [Tanacetum coccineum]
MKRSEASKRVMALGRLVRYVMMIGKKKRLYYGAVEIAYLSHTSRSQTVARMINLPQAAVLPKRAIQNRAANSFCWKCIFSLSADFHFSISLSVSYCFRNYWRHN